MSMAACFPGARVEKTWSRDFGGNGKNRWKESKGESETEVSGQLMQIMERQSKRNRARHKLQRTDCSGSA